MAIRFQNTDNGNCRVYYRSTDSRTLYCFQEDWPGQFTLYRCSRDGEPSHQVELEPGTDIEGMPQDESSTARSFRAWRNLNGEPQAAR